MTEELQQHNFETAEKPSRKFWDITEIRLRRYWDKIVSTISSHEVYSSGKPLKKLAKEKEAYSENGNVLQEHDVMANRVR